jgi:RNA polymerase sigma-70 factor (ECF subfamily)
MTGESMSEQSELVQRCQQGDLAAFSELFHSQQTRIFRLAATILRDEEDAQDVVQDALLRVFEQIKMFQGQAAFQTWLTAIVVNLCRDRLRRRKVRYALSLEWLRGWPSAGDMADEVADDQGRQSLWSFVAALDEKYRLPVILHYYEELPCDEIAEILNLRTTTVYSRLNTARLRLRAMAQTAGAPAGRKVTQRYAGQL